MSTRHSEKIQVSDLSAISCGMEAKTRENF